MLLTRKMSSGDSNFTFEWKVLSKMINLRILLAVSFHLSSVWGLAVKQLSLLMSCLKKKKKDCSSRHAKVASFSQEETFSTRLLSSPDFIIFTKQLGHQSLKKKNKSFPFVFSSQLAWPSVNGQIKPSAASRVNSLLSAFVHLHEQLWGTNLLHAAAPCFEAPRCVRVSGSPQRRSRGLQAARAQHLSAAATCLGGIAPSAPYPPFLLFWGVVCEVSFH